MNYLVDTCLISELTASRTSSLQDPLRFQSGSDFGCQHDPDGRNGSDIRARATDERGAEGLVIASSTNHRAPHKVWYRGPEVDMKTPGGSRFLVGGWKWF